MTLEREAAPVATMVMFLQDEIEWRRREVK
jgi:hypothetical protein